MDPIASAQAYAAQYGVDPNLVTSIWHQESGMNPNVRDSSAGAIGIGQLMPATARSLGVDPRDPQQNMEGSVRYMRQLQDRFGNNPSLIAAAYNAGPERLQRSLDTGEPLPAETQQYVPAVLGRMQPSNQAPMAQAMGQPSMPDQGSYLFGNNPTPVGLLGGLSRALGIGSEPELGRRLQNAGAALMSVGNFGRPGMAGAAAMQEAANMPHFNMVTDALGNRIAFDTRTGAPISVNGRMVNAAGSPGFNNRAPTAGGDDGTSSMTQDLASAPISLAKGAELDQDASAKLMQQIEDDATKADTFQSQNVYAKSLASRPDVIQGPGIVNDVKEFASEHSGGTLAGNISAQNELDKLNAKLVGGYLSSLPGIRAAGPEIKFAGLASPDREHNTQAANIQIYDQNIQDAQRAKDIAGIARQYYAKYHVLGPEFRQAVHQYMQANPVAQPTTVSGTQGGQMPPLSSFWQKQ